MQAGAECQGPESSDAWRSSCTVLPCLAWPKGPSPGVLSGCFGKTVFSDSAEDEIAEFEPVFAVPAVVRNHLCYFRYYFGPMALTTAFR